MDIKLNLYDLYKIGKYLGLESTSQLFNKKIVSLSKGQNGIDIPKMIFKTSPYTFCPFLINDMDEDMNLKGYCSLHPYKKPLVCILAPISKEYDTETLKENYSFTKPTENCPGTLSDDEFDINELLKPVASEIKYENRYFSILEYILANDIKNYQDKLYHFKLKDSFDEIIESKANFFLPTKKQ